MSHKGKLLRGEKWWAHRNQDSELPDDIKDNPNRMSDVNYFLKDKEAKEKPKEKKVK